LELRRPKISEELPPFTRLRTTEEAPGWLKRTAAAEPMENDCQSMMARLLDD
jgi:hypothetical protein